MASSLAAHAYDTLSIARSLERDYAFGEKQAEGIARTIHEHLVANVATKDDLENLRVELIGRIVELDGKIDEVRVELIGRIVELDGKIDEVRVELIGRIDNLDGKIDEVRVELIGRIVELDGKIDEVRVELIGRIVELDGKIGAVRSELDGRLVQVHREIVALNGRVDRLEDRIDNLGKALTFRMGAMIATGIGLLAALQAVIG